jgi:hypothetical protein
MRASLEEEIEIDVAAVIPAHLKSFQDVTVESVNGREVYLIIDGEKLKGRIGDSIYTNLFFSVNEETREAEMVAACNKEAKLEHVFYIPREEFTKPFVPTDALRSPT